MVERQHLLQQRDDLVAQIATLTDEIQVQQATIRLDRRIVSRKLGLQAEGIMPIDVLEVAQRQLAGDESSLLAQRLSLQKLRQSLYDTEAQLHELPLKQATELDDLARQLAAAEGDLPLLRDGRLYCGSGDRHFYVADLNSCELEDVVKIHVGSRVYSSPRVAGNRIVFGCTSGLVCEIDATTLRTEGLLQLPDAVTNAIAVSNDGERIFAATYVNELYAFERQPAG